MDPNTGRFTTRDTIGIWADAANRGNPYTNANNNPWSSLDPFGTDASNAAEKPVEEEVDYLEKVIELEEARRNELEKKMEAFDEWMGNFNPLEETMQTTEDALKGRLDKNFYVDERNLDAYLENYGGNFDYGVNSVEAIANSAAAEGGTELFYVVITTNPVAKSGKSLRARMGNPPPGFKKPQAHHGFPVAKEFEGQWERLGIDINDPQFGRWVEGGPYGNHQKWSNAYNQEWRDYFEHYPYALREQVIEKLNELNVDPRFQ